MAYDPEKDKKVAVIAGALSPDGADMELAIYQYDGGDKKVRLTVTRRGYTTAIVKLNPGEWQWLQGYAPKVNEALK